jgi:hypothetical protein
MFEGLETLQHPTVSDNNNKREWVIPGDDLINQERKLL